MCFLRLSGKPRRLSLHMQSLKNILGKPSSNRGKSDSQELYEEPRESDFFFLGRGGQVEGVSFWCWMKLDDRESRGETQLQKPLGLRKMSHPLAMNGQLHLLNTLGARAKKPDLVARDAGETTHHRTLPHSQRKLNKQPIYQRLAAQLSFSLFV